MAGRRRRGPRGPGARPPRAGQPTLRASPDEEPDLLDEVREFLRVGDGLDLVMYASTLVSALEPPPTSPFEDDEDGAPSLAEVVGSFIAIRRDETTALLAALAHLVTDELLLQRIGRELDARNGPVPAGIDRLAPLTVDHAAAATTVLGASETLVIGVRTADDQPLTVVADVDHELGTVVVDGFGFPGPADVVMGRMEEAEDDNPDLTVAEIDPADARARISEAIETGRITFPPFETDTWPGSRPLLEWVLRALPPGGTGHVRPEVDEDEREEIARRFLGSPHGREHDHPNGRDLLGTLLWYGCDYGTGDPLTWSQQAVAILLDDWLPRKVVADPEYLDLAPDLLRSFIRFGHEERGLREELTDDALEVVDALEPGYRQVIRTARPQGPAALLAAMGWIDEDQATGSSPFGDDRPHLAVGRHYDQLLWLLAEAVGGEEELRTLTADPLPDEPFDRDVVPDDIREKVGEVVALLDRCAEELFDVEFRTAARRLLADVVVSAPEIFRRRGRADTAAAAIAWIVGKANDVFGPYGNGLSIGELSAWFGLSGSPSQRAATMLAALDIDTDAYSGMYLGTTRYLISTRRQQILRRREFAEEDLAGLDALAHEDVWGEPGWDDEPSWDDSDLLDDGDPWDGPGPLDDLAVPELGVDPALPAPWRQPDRVDVLAVGWFRSGAFGEAVRRWPELAARVGTTDHGAYVRVVQGTLLDVSREHGHHPVLVAFDSDALGQLEAFADEVGLDVTDWRTRAGLAAVLAEAGRGVPWPPGRNDPCWCGSGRKYKKCCDTVPADPARRDAPADGPGMAQAYELEVSLAHVQPRIWRRIAIAADATFGDLHDAIQDACGWERAHLFAFSTPDGQVIGEAPVPGGMGGPFGEPGPDASSVPLASWFAGHDRCHYEYDFGDGWLHDVTVVRRIEEPVDYRRRLLDGARALPPEDCGGLPGYEECVEVATGGDDPDELREWLGDWDPERFDLAGTRRRFDR